MGPILALVCLLGSLAGPAASVVGVVRHGLRRAGLAWVGLPGGCFVWAWMVLWSGLAEGVWTQGNPVAWIVGAVGTLGVVLIVIAWRSALRPKVLPGHCPACAYPLTGRGPCPE